MIPSATSYGAAVQSACEDGLAPVTTGHGTTIAAVIQTVRPDVLLVNGRIHTMAERDAVVSTVHVVGDGGTILRRTGTQWEQMYSPVTLKRSAL